MRALSLLLSLTVLGGCSMNIDRSRLFSDAGTDLGDAPPPSNGGTTSPQSAGPDGGPLLAGGGTGGGNAPNGGPSARDECGVQAKAEAQIAPTDVIWAIDTSGSMQGFFPAIQDALGRFSTKVNEAGLDARIILLAGSGLCVPEPVGSGNCGTGGQGGPGGSGGNFGGAGQMGTAAEAPDTLRPGFLHLDTPFGMNGGMGIILSNYEAYRDLLRPGAQTHVVMTEDGDSPIAAEAVIAHIEGRQAASGACGGGPLGGLGGGGGCPMTGPWDPGLVPGRWNFHGVLCLGGAAGGAGAGGLGGLEGLLGGLVCGAGNPANTLAVIEQTGGLAADLGQASAGGDPFGELLDKLAERVIVNAIGCDYAIPDANALGQRFETDKVNVFYTASDGTETQFGKAESPIDCGTSVGWHFDDNAQPSKLLLCPAACAQVQADVNAQLDVQFGCESVGLI